MRNKEQIYGRNDMVLLDKHNKIYGSLGIIEPYVFDTKTGETIIMENPKKGKFEDVVTEFNVYGKSTQQTTKGVNLLNLGDIGRVITSKDKTGTAVVKENGVQVTYTGQTTPINSDIYFYGNKDNYVESGYEEVPELTPGNYYIRNKSSSLMFYVVAWRDNGNVILANTNNSLSNMFTIKQGDKFRIFLRPLTSEMIDVLEQLMIVRDKDLNAPYEPYTGGKPSPSIEYPQEIMSAGDKGNVNIQVKGNVEPVQNLLLHTPNGLPGIPVYTGGNYTDNTGQQWVTDEINLGRGKYVQRVILEKINKVKIREVFGNPNVYAFNVKNLYKLGDKPSFSNFAIYSPWAGKEGTCCINVNEVRYKPFGTKTLEEVQVEFDRIPEIIILGQLQTTIETDLTPEEITDYKALCTNYPTTKIVNDENAGMKVTYKQLESKTKAVN